jgi:hypothetical protein
LDLCTPSLKGHPFGKSHFGIFNKNIYTRPLPCQKKTSDGIQSQGEVTRTIGGDVKLETDARDSMTSSVLQLAKV